MAKRNGNMEMHMNDRLEEMVLYYKVIFWEILVS